MKWYIYLKDVRKCDYILDHAIFLNLYFKKTLNLLLNNYLTKFVILKI